MQEKPGSDDRALAARFLRTRDESAFRALYRRHTPAMYAFALRVLGHGAGEAEDAVQDAWIRALDRLGAFRWESSFRTWLTGILLNCCRERLKGGWRWVQTEEDAQESPAAGAAPDLTADLDRAMAGLPPGSRAVFVLHDVEGHSHEEIAALLDIAPGTSKSQLFHARRHLRRQLQ